MKGALATAAMGSMAAFYFVTQKTEQPSSLPEEVTSVNEATQTMSDSLEGFLADDEFAASLSQFLEWSALHNKQYTTDTEFETRFEVFR